MTMPTVVDGVERAPANGIHVVIVGAGVGGLATALECWRKGCEVTVLERADGLSTQGDFFTISPNGVSTLRYYPNMWADYHGCVYDAALYVYSTSGQILSKIIPEWKRPGAVHAASGVDISSINRRPVFAQMQLDQLERLKLPVHWGQKVISVEEDEKKVIVRTATGEEITGDICVVANGINPQIDGFHMPSNSEVQNSGYAIARVAFPAKVIKEDSPAASFLVGLGTEPQLRVYLGKDVHLILFLTIDWVALCLTHKNDGTAKESWGNLQDAGILLEHLHQTGQDWDPAVVDFLKQVPDKVVDWNLRWRDSTDEWTSQGGRLVRVGDAAHTFLPTSGNGATQALEDAISLGECLRLGGKEHAQSATKVHTQLRFQRTSVLQQTGFVNRDLLHTSGDAPLPKNSKDKDLGFFKVGRWTWAHNPEAYARENYEACLANVKNGVPFKNTNLPPGHVYEPWSLESENKRMKAGIPSNLKQNGYWGTEETICV